MKLININIGIKINNTVEISELFRTIDADIINIQEVASHCEDTVFEKYRSRRGIEETIGRQYPYKFFGPLWISGAIKNELANMDFGGLIEMGNEIMSKFPILYATNEFYYKAYSYTSDWTNWEQEDHGRAVQIAELNITGKKLQILNLHGIYTRDKQGDQRTVAESKRVIEVAKRKDLPTIIAGDFNLAPETESIQLINKEFRNLINEYKIKSTRPDFKRSSIESRNVVDYIFVNDRIKVNEFKVINTSVSDHLPVLLNFDIL